MAFTNKGKAFTESETTLNCKDEEFISSIQIRPANQTGWGVSTSKPC